MTSSPAAFLGIAENEVWESQLSLAFSRWTKALDKIVGRR